MQYLVYDLEFNQAYNHNSNKSNPQCPFEIIQIGAIKLDENFNTISTLNKIIKPKIYPVLHPYVEKITNLSYEELSHGQDFKDVYEELLTFLGPEETILSVWGIVDIKELFRNISYYQLSSKNIPRIYINIQKHASNYFNSPKGSNVGLRTSVELLNIPIQDDFHNALSDAHYTVEVFKKIYDSSMKPTTYTFNRISRNPQQKEELDIERLIKQFEKMYNRQMTNEEVSIIKLAYIMGKTNQFQKHKSP